MAVSVALLLVRGHHSGNGYTEPAAFIGGRWFLKKGAKMAIDKGGATGKTAAATKKPAKAKSKSGANGAAMNRASHGIRLVREQCYVCWMSAPEKAVEPPMPIEQLRQAHHEYFVDLERKGILFAAGPFMDEKGQRHGLGMMIVRAKSLAAARRLAAKEPYTRVGMRIMTVTPWQLNEGSIQLSVRFAESRLSIDGRSWVLSPEDE